MRSGVCGYLCLMERLIEEKPEAHSGAPIGSQESADPDTSTLNIYLSFAPILPPCLFFFSSSSSSLLSAHLSHLFLPPCPPSACYPSSGDTFSLLPRFTFLFSFLLTLLCSLSLHIFPYLPVTPPPPPLLSLPPPSLSVVELQ